MKIASIGIDIGKTTFHLVALDEHGSIVIRRKFSRKSNKNDYLDAEAIAEAVTRQNMRFVPIKTEDQLDLQGLHRVRERRR